MTTEQMVLVFAGCIIGFCGMAALLVVAAVIQSSRISEHQRIMSMFKTSNNFEGRDAE